MSTEREMREGNKEEERGTRGRRVERPGLVLAMVNYSLFFDALSHSQIVRPSVCFSSLVRFWLCTVLYSVCTWGYSCVYIMSVEECG